MLISDIELYLVEIGCVGRERPIRSLVARLATDSGLEGWGESQTEWLAEELPARRNALLPALAGRSVYDIEELLGLAALRPAPLRAAVEIASWDLVGRAARQPLCRLFGGEYRRQMPVAVRLSGRDPREIARLARELAEQGFHSQVVPSWGDPEADAETLAAVRQMLPDRTEIRLDGAAGYDFESAWRLCLEIECLRPQFFLDPLRSPDLEQTASLRRQTGVPLAVRRALRGPSDVLALVRCGAASLALVDLELVGGLTPARKCGAIAQAAGLGASLATGPSLGIGLAALLHLAASTPAFSGPIQCAYHHLQDDLLTEPLKLVDGMMAVPPGPGLGVEVDRKKVERYQVG